VRGRRKMLEKESITRLLETRSYGRSLDVRALTQSTNDDAREAAAAGAPRGHVVVADAQDRGRGSHGRTWSSPAGTDLYLSIVERITLPPAAIATVTLAVGLGVTDAIAELAPSLAPRVRVKWPNDAWIDRRKTAGILVESSSSGAVQGPIVIGIGLGVNRLSWDDALAGQATSLLDATRGTPFDRNRVLAILLACVERAVDALVRDGVAPTVARLAQRLAMLGEPVEIDGTRGTLLGLDERGAIRIMTDEGTKTLSSGTLRPT
jgi:BirA family biotin operon repressor/biotin-[acetyl-CoA-carboxylase] ligase